MSTMPAHSHSGLRTIGEVLAELRGDFPDLTSSKLRFLESEGLVAPARLPNGYRKYTDANIARLRLVLTLQRDRYLPLRVIKEKLAAHDAGEDVLAETRPAPTVDVRDGRDQEAAAEPDQGLRHRIAELASETFQAPPQPTSYGREELLAESGLSRAALAEIIDARLIAPLPSGRFDEDALIVATLVAGLLRRGLQVRHIKPARHTVEREIGNIETLVATQRRRRLSGELGDQQGLVDTSRELAGGFLALHAVLLRSALRSSL